MFHKGDIIQFRQERATDLEEVIAGPYLHLSKALIADSHIPVGAAGGGTINKQQLPAHQDRLLVQDIKYYPQHQYGEVQEIAYYHMLNLDSGQQTKLTPYYAELNYRVIA